MAEDDPKPRQAIEVASTESLPVPGQQVDSRPNPAVVYLASLSTAKSRRTQKCSLERILKVIKMQGQPVETFPWWKLRYEHAQLIRSQLSDAYAPRTANVTLAALRSVIHVAWNLEQIDTDTYMRIKDIRGVKGHREPKGRHVTPGEVRSLYEACKTFKDPWLGARNAAMLSLLFGLGMRREEVAKTNVDSVDLETGAITIIGKGNKERSTYLPRGGVAAVRTWVRKYRPQPRGKDREGPTIKAMLLSAKHGYSNMRLSEGGIVHALNEVARRAGVKEFSPHDMRRTFIGEMLDAGADLSTVQKMVGHASPTTTSRYDRRGERAKQRSADLLHVPFTEEEEGDR